MNLKATKPIRDMPLKLIPNKLHDEAIVEFTTISGRHFRLALCERKLWDERVQKKYLYLSDDGETYTTMTDFSGVGVPDLYHSLKVEGFNFVYRITEIGK